MSWWNKGQIREMPGVCRGRAASNQPTAEDFPTAGPTSTFVGGLGKCDSHRPQPDIQSVSSSRPFTPDIENRRTNNVSQ